MQISERTYHAHEWKELILFNVHTPHNNLPKAIQRNPHKEAKYTFFSNAYGTFSKIDHMIGHKASRKKFKKIEIISSIFSDHKALKLETNPKGKNPKHSKSWRLNSMLLNNEWVKNEIREEIKNFPETNKNKLTAIQSLWDTVKAVLRGKFRAI